MMACLLGLFRTERLAREISAVTRVIDILIKKKTREGMGRSDNMLHVAWAHQPFLFSFHFTSTHTEKSRLTAENILALFRQPSN